MENTASQETEYTELGENIRFYANLRFVQLTILITITGGIFAAIFSFTTLKPQISLLLKISGALIAVVFLIMEYRASQYWDRYFERAKELDEQLGYQQYRTSPPRQRITATTASRILHFAIILFWILLVFLGDNPLPVAASVDPLLLIGLLVQLVIAIFTAVAAFAAARSARSSQEMTQGQIALTFRHDYSRDDMYEAFGIIDDWWRDNESASEDVLVELQGSRLPKELDLARRRISHWFENINVMKKERILNGRFVRAVVSEEQVRYWITKVEPLECAKNSGYNQQVFSDLRSVYPKIERPKYAHLKGWNKQQHLR